VFCYRVTDTYREVCTMFPGFRVMAMSMEGLEIDIAGVSSIPIDMVDLKLVSMVERTVYRRCSARPVV